MDMTEDEIVREYRMAKYKRSQVGILADLNLTDRGTIEKILAYAGEALPKGKQYRRRMTGADRGERIPAGNLEQLIAEMERIDAEIAERERRYRKIAGMLKAGKMQKKQAGGAKNERQRIYCNGK